MGTTRILIAALMTTATLASTSPEDAFFYEQSAYLKNDIAYCKVHDRRLLQDNVPVRYGFGIKPDHYQKIENKYFPNAIDCVYAGCIIAPGESPAKILYCPECRRSKQKYHDSLQRKKKNQLLEKIRETKDVKSWTHENGDTLLHLAAQDGFPDVIKMLLDQGLDVNAPGDHGKRPLHCAVKSKDVDSVKVLLESGADIEGKNDFKQAALYIACACSTKEVVQVLLESGADINATDVGKDTPLRAAKGRHPEVPHLWKFLEDQGAYYYTEYIELVKNCKKGNNPHSRFLLLEAAKKREFNAVKTLIQNGVNINSCDSARRTALHISVLANWSTLSVNFVPNAHLIELLVEAGIDVNAQDYEGKTAMHCIIEEGPEPADIYYHEIIKCLIDGGADLGLKDRNGFTPLGNVLSDPSVTRLLIEGGADVNLKRPFEDPLLFDAIRRAEADMVKFLIDAGADLKAKNRAGQSPLEAARRDEWKSILNRMIEGNEDKEFIDEYRQDCERNMKRIVELLRSHGADE